MTVLALARHIDADTSAAPESFAALLAQLGDEACERIVSRTPPVNDRETA